MEIFYSGMYLNDNRIKLLFSDIWNNLLEAFDIYMWHEVTKKLFSRGYDMQRSGTYGIKILSSYF